MKIQNLEAIKQCPRFNKCGCPICPLDTDMEKRVYIKSEEKCTLARSLRQRLGRNVPWRGLFPRELAGLSSWAGRSEESTLRTMHNLALGRSKGSITSGSKTQGGDDGI